ncbi:MAG: hypothetical protein ABR562_08730, partial [Thermoplasmatota archaeon]
MPDLRLRVGLLVNPVAGMGGPGAYKGSDRWQDAAAHGYAPTAPERARRFLQLVGDRVEWTTVPGAMGLDHFTPPPAPKVVLADAPFAFGTTSRDDTARAAQALRDAGVAGLLLLPAAVLRAAAPERLLSGRGGQTLQRAFVGAFAGAAGLGIAFFARSARHPAPVVELSILRERRDFDAETTRELATTVMRRIAEESDLAAAAEDDPAAAALA